jgi:hypothetical protein
MRLAGCEREPHWQAAGIDPLRESYWSGRLATD